MYPIRRILLGIDQSPTDDILIQFTAKFAALADTDKIYIIHAAKNLELPEKVIEKYPDLIAPVDENIIRETNILIDKYFDDTLKSRTEIMILEGNPAKTILKEISVKEIDMLVMGKKSNPESTGYLARKMALLAIAAWQLSPECRPSTGIGYLKRYWCRLIFQNIVSSPWKWPSYYRNGREYRLLTASIFFLFLHFMGLTMTTTTRS